MEDGVVIYVYIHIYYYTILHMNLWSASNNNKQASKQQALHRSKKPRHSQLVCRNPANSFLMESPSGALNENTNGSSQLSVGRAGRWCEVEKCGFLVPSQKMVVLDLIFIYNLSWCNSEPFYPGDLFM